MNSENILNQFLSLFFQFLFMCGLALILPSLLFGVFLLCVTALIAGLTEKLFGFSTNIGGAK